MICAALISLTAAISAWAQDGEASGAGDGAAAAKVESVSADDKLAEVNAKASAAERTGNNAWMLTSSAKFRRAGSGTTIVQNLYKNWRRG